MIMDNCSVSESELWWWWCSEMAIKLTWLQKRNSLSFYLSFYCSLTFPSTPFRSSFQPPPVLFFDHSCTLCTCSSFFIFACDFFVPCYFLHSFPLNIACDILFVSFTPVSVFMTTPYISDSIYIVIVFVFSSLACNWFIGINLTLLTLLTLFNLTLNFVELNLLPCLLRPLYLYWFRDPAPHSTNSNFTLLYS